MRPEVVTRANPQPVAAAAPTRMSFLEWRALALLVLSVGINYIDRGSLSIAAPVLSKELGLAPDQMGLLLSSFFWTYASFQLVAGWLVDRYRVNLVFGIGFFLWSLATAATGFTSSFAMLLLLRVLLGAGESVAYPAYSKIIATGFPERNRGLTNALIDAGSKCGPAFGTLVGGLLVANYGWRFLFLALGAGSLLWLIPWAFWAPKIDPRRAVHRDDVPGFFEILRLRSAWGTFIGLFCLNYAWYFLISWLPSYLVQERHFSLSMMAIMGSVPFWGLAASATAAGWLSDNLIARGASPTRVRKGFAASGLLLCTIVLPAAIVDNPWVCVGLITAACLTFGLCTSNHWAITQTIAGPAAAGKWTGMQNGFGNLAGVAAPYLTGLIVARTGSFYLAFVMVAVLLVIGAASYVFVIGPLVPVDWKKRNV